MNWKRIGNALLFPPAAVLIVLTPIAAAALVYSMLRLEETSPVRIGSYVLAFYTLVIVCVRVPKVARSIGTFKRENKYIQFWSNDPRLRMNITVGGSVLWNGAYAALQLGLAIYYRSAWLYSLAAYYATLAAMRCSLVWHTLRYTPGEQMRQELTRYRACGWVFLLTNLALSGIMFYMIYEHRVTRHGEIITITMAAYTFTTLTMAIINVIRYRKFNSPSKGHLSRRGLRFHADTGKHDARFVQQRSYAAADRPAVSRAQRRGGFCFYHCHGDLYDRAGKPKTQILGRIQRWKIKRASK